jgi:hypothetical protein
MRDVEWRWSPNALALRNYCDAAFPISLPRIARSLGLSLAEAAQTLDI